MPLSVRFPPEAIKAIDAMVEQGGYKDRSDVIRDALSLLMEVLEEEKAGRIVVAVDRKSLDESSLVVKLR